MTASPLIRLLFCAALAQPALAQKQQPVAPPLPPTAYVLEDAFPGLKFDLPIAIVPVPGDKDKLVIVERAGRLQLLTSLAGTPTKELMFDLTKPRDGAITVEGECGLLGLAFHPDYASNGRFFVYYSLRINGQLCQRVSEFNQKDAGAEQPLITQEDPASNHNGGDLHFGPDGYLYITVGDGGAGNDKFDNGRFINKGFHAAILRIDVDKKKDSVRPNPHPAIALDSRGAAFYAVPKDNPFHGATSHHGQAIDPKSVRTEIFATGLRNPWRMCFDPASGRLFTGDVGQNLYEEIDIIVKGGDYGWSYREGLHPFPLGPGGAAEPQGFKPVEPIFEYPRTMGLSVTGGVVYHGAKLKDLTESYIFADYAFGRIIALREASPQWQPTILAVEAGVVSLGTDPRDGEVLFANMALGQIKRLKKQ
ncbi:MAG TPA: PQQ-dependent sugar dehydrogenase [Prosthecobacter sp.]|nr:PQQ-dependent sugar dehydrogenase [Prosthecobacter sp.]